MDIQEAREILLSEAITARLLPSELDAIRVLLTDHARLVERNRILEDALRDLVAAVDQVSEDSRGVFTLAHIHGMPYKGKNWKAELDAARLALDARSAGEQLEALNAK